ncbi:MAG: IS200/IS605 family transposase ISCbt1 [Anaerolineae bacterium]|nr:IS200/IS605 family transposase ISCbt1 [Anaerolineae bacterium]
MARITTPSFITEIEVALEPGQERSLLVRLEVARQLYNAVLGESLKRLSLMRQSKGYQAALKMPKKVKPQKGKKMVSNPERIKAFKEVREQYGFREYDLHAYAGQIKQSWIGEHLDINTVQKVATRAFQATFQYAVGKRGRPRFKGKNQFDSVEGKNQAAGILLRDVEDQPVIKWKGLVLNLRVPPDDAVIRHGLESPVKYVRLVRRKIRGRNRFYAQLVNEGKPYQKPGKVIGTGEVGLDIGPSTIAFVSDTDAGLELFVADIADKEAEIARLQRAVERQRRLNNPDNYEPTRWVKNANGNWVRKQGRIKPGRHQWVVSSRMKRNQEKLAELHRRLAAHRKSLHGELINRILSYGNHIKTEKLSYRAFQKMFGKSVGKRAPGSFMTRLRLKAGSAGGEVVEFPTRSTKLSRTCHECGTIREKPLFKRWHICDCGVIAQRDLYSAFLAKCVENDRLNVRLAKESWPGADFILRAALGRIKPASDGRLPASFGLNRSLSWSPAMFSMKLAKTSDVVGHQIPLVAESR